MCIRPKFILVRQDKCKPWKVDAYKRVADRFADSDIHKRIYPYWMNKVLVPCGNCVECLRARQNDLAARVVLAAKQYNSMHFWTLTYDEVNIPLSARKAFVFKDTGEVVLDSVPKSIVRLKRTQENIFSDEMVAYFRRKIIDMKRSKNARVLFVPWLTNQEDKEYDEYYYITPSLHRRDVKLWLKRCRVYYEREFGKPLSDFKYVFAGEFGPNTCRPHYHIITLGLSDKEVAYMRNSWEHRFGFTKVMKIPAFNKDGSSGYVLAAKYISKYIIKGEFEADSVLNGYCEKPRVCLSRYIGTSIPDELVDYYRCTDVFGRYGLDSLVVEKGSRFDRQLSLSDLVKLYNEVRKRAVLRLGSSWLPLPKAVMRSLFSVDDYYYSILHEKNVKFARQSVVQMAFSSFVESDFLADLVSEFRSLGREPDEETAFIISSWFDQQKGSVEIKESAGKAAFQSFYAKSKF